MMGISLNGQTCPRAGDQSYSVNDQFKGAEWQAPVFSHGISTSAQPIQPIAFASAFPWLGQKVNNTVQFKVGASATFVGLVHPANTYAFYNSGFSNDPSVDKKGIARASVRALQADGLELTTPDPRSSVRPRTR